LSTMSFASLQMHSCHTGGASQGESNGDKE